MKFLAVLVLVIFVRSSHGDSHQIIPVQYITPSDQRGSDGEKACFILQLCGGAQLDKSTATVYINFPDIPWSIDDGDYLMVNVVDSKNNIVKANSGEKVSFLQQFSFPYNKSYGDLRVNITVGPTNSLIYTVSVHFQLPESARFELSPGFRPYTTYDESEAVAEMKWRAENNEFDQSFGDTVAVMRQIVRTQDPLQVKTADKIYLSLLYCFDFKSLPKTVTVNTVASDSISAFKTYGCLGDPSCPVTTPYRDTTGSAVNTIRIPITKPEQLEKIVNLKIYGRGDFGSMNQFRLSASTN